MPYQHYEAVATRNKVEFARMCGGGCGLHGYPFQNPPDVSAEEKAAYLEGFERGRFQRLATRKSCEEES